MPGDEVATAPIQQRAMTMRIPTPLFSAENFRTYIEEVSLWKEVCELPEEKQGIVLWLALPRDHPSDIKELILAKIGDEELKKKTGVKKFIEAMNEAFKPSNESRELEIYTEYYVKVKRKEDEKVSDFVNRFDKAANFAKRHKMDLPTKVKGLKLLHDAGLTEQDMKLVLTEIDFEKEEEVYKDAKMGLAKYMRDGNSQTVVSPAIKLEALTAQDEEVLVAKGWSRPGARGGGGGNWGARSWGGRGGASRGGGGRGGSASSSNAGPKKNENPKDAKGDIIRCPSCESVRHLLADCPDSYENLRKIRSMALAAAPVQEEQEEAYFTDNLAGIMRKMEQSGEAEDIILYTGSWKKITGLGGETLGSLLLDCGCSSNVAGEGWWNSYQASLSSELKRKVQVYPSGGKKFRFGGGELLTSTKLVKFPGRLAGKDVMFSSHVVQSNIPLLWSRPAMARAGTVLDLPKDRAKILGVWVDLDLTDVGHYALDILPLETVVTEQCLATLPMDVKEKEATLRKLHRQFGHPRQEVMVGLLRKVNCADKEARKMVASIHESCATCKRFSPTPPRPVVSLPQASDFGEVLTLDGAGEQVYYRRDGDKAAWRGPATVLGSRGSVHFLVHQGDVVRVAACRIVAIGEAEEQIGTPESKEEQKILTRQASALEPVVELEPGREEEPRDEVVQPAAGEDGVQAGVRQQEEEYPQQQAEVPGEQAEVPGEQADIPVQQGRGGRTEGVARHGSNVRRQMRLAPYPKAGDRIQHRDGGDWQAAEVLSRGGKSTSKYADYFNVRGEVRRPGIVWLLRKAVYGMNDAGRRWYFKVEQVLTSLGCKKSLYDHCLFSYRGGGELAGIILLWVNDIFYAGNQQFQNEVMIKVAEEFLVGKTEEGAFTYIGLNIKSTSEGITLDQIDYIRDRPEPAVLKGGDNSRPLDQEEMTLLRRQTGKINWAASQTRPDLSYTVVELSTKFKSGVLEDLKKSNKAITRLTSSPTKLLFPKITGGLKIVVYSDAAFQNLPDQISSGSGHIVMLAGQGGRGAPLGWASNKVRRVGASTVAAEALSLQMALSHAVYLRAVLTETLGVDELAIPIHSFIDSNNLHQAINSTLLDVITSGFLPREDEKKKGGEDERRVV